MLLTRKARDKFYKDHPFYVRFLPFNMKNLLAIKWVQNYLCVDILHYEIDGFDYFIKHPIKDIVFSSGCPAGERLKDYDEVIGLALIESDKLINRFLI